ncbi:MAG: hypothetical protein PHV33_12800 [Elusimicrobiales bacterium]|nr:hypothetical protein [Elusimicrobiales bacterium]
MKTLHRHGKYDNNSTFKAKLENVLLPQSLDTLFLYMKKHPIPEYEKFRMKLLSLLKTEPLPAKDIKILEKLLVKAKNLGKDREVGIAAISKLVEVLGLKKIPALNKAVSLKCNDYYRVYLLQCYVIKALASVMPKKAALAYFRKFTEYRYGLWKLPRYENVVQKLDLSEAVKKGPLKDGVVFVDGVTEDGRAALKITKCRPCNILMKEVNDGHIVYEVICHQDYQLTNLCNPNFVLTREKSIALGMPYCGHMWHDKRAHKGIKHPSRKFWQELN